MKKILFALFAFLFVSAPALQAQGQTDVFILGKSKGSVSSMQAGGHTLVDARAAAKKLGGTVELFSASKQIKIAFPGMYAILSAPLKEAIINTVTVPLPAETVASGGKIYVPVQFFMLPQVQKALDRKITFERNALVVERNFTLAFSALEQKPAYDRLSLFRSGQIVYSSKQINKHTAQVVFRNVVLKRNISQRPKDSFIRSFTLTQRGKNAELKVIFGKRGAVWAVREENGELTFSVAAKTLPDGVKSAADRPAVSAPEPGASAGKNQNLSSNDGAEELDLHPSSGLTPSVISEAGAEEPQRQPPVIKPAPQPVISATAGPVIKAKRTMRIVVDPGHGGKDPGATRRGSSREKDLNLAVAKHLYNYLKKQGFDVKLTRGDDTFVTLAGRSKMANEYKADLFVSVHTNAAKRSAANGFEVYFRSDKATDKEAAEVAAFENEALQYEETHYNFVDMLLQSLAKTEYMNESSKLAGHVRNYVYKEPGIGIAVRQNNAIRQANFYVLKGVQAPAILVEMGYISSPKDRGRLNNKAVQKRMGEAIAKGIVSYAKAEGRMK